MSEEKDNSWSTTIEMPKREVESLDLSKLNPDTPLAIIEQMAHAMGKKIKIEIKPNPSMEQEEFLDGENN